LQWVLLDTNVCSGGDHTLEEIDEKLESTSFLNRFKLKEPIFLTAGLLKQLISLIDLFKENL